MPGFPDKIMPFMDMPPGRSGRALHMRRVDREMFCLMEGRHVHPSTPDPGGVGTVATPQLFTDARADRARCCSADSRPAASAEYRRVSTD